MTVTYGQSGYCGSSRSCRAAEAEDEGKLPLTRATAELAARLGITRKAARAVLTKVGPCEAHHTSKYANLTDYYDLAAAADRYDLDNDPLAEYVEEARDVEEYGYDGWRWLGGIIYSGRTELESLFNSTREAYELDILPARRVAEINMHHEKNGCRIQASANFRRWEAALRRIAAGEAA